MHPLFANPRRLALYVIAWVPFASIVYAIVEHAGPVDPLSDLLLSLVMAPPYAVLALSALYSCRLAPLRSSSSAFWIVAVCSRPTWPPLKDSSLLHCRSSPSRSRFTICSSRCSSHV